MGEAVSAAVVRLHEVNRGPVSLTFAPDEAERAGIARDLGLVAVPALKAEVTVKPWLDGAEVLGRFRATVGQTCVVTLDDFDAELAGEFTVRLVPAGSVNAPAEALGEIELDAEADDPPDVVEGDVIDVGAYVIEHLALSLDPYPRKPGAAFDYQPPAEETSPFAALKALKGDAE